MNEKTNTETQLKANIQPSNSHTSASEQQPDQANKAKKAKELGGPKGLEPTRYGDWESKGRCYDF